MKRFLKWIGIALGAVVLLVLLGAAWIFVSSNSKVNRHYEIAVEPISIPSPDSAAVAHGEYIARSRGCYDCHGEQLEGRLIMDAMPMARVSAPNLTPGGPVASFSDEDWIRAIRHGVGTDGRSFWVMPSVSYQNLSESDLGALIAYLKAIPAAPGPEAVKELGPIGRMLVATGQLAMVADKVDHGRPAPTMPPVAATPEYGAYVAGICSHCHGEHFNGGLVEGPPGSPPSSNLTPHETGLAAYTEADFFRALREGTKPDGTRMNPENMPWTATAAMSDIEIQALWAFLRSIEPRPTGP